MKTPLYDLAIIGGGVNGCGIARDAAGRGLSVFLCEQNDLASGTSSASTKLIHGGLRYLEYYEFRLVREALKEREILLRAAPHIIWPLRFILPHHQGLRPYWLIRLGLFIYDNLGGRKLLPGTSTVDLKHDESGTPLKNLFTKAFEYSDCWVMDSRLVILNAMDARDKGAHIQTRTRCLSATRLDDVWHIKLENTTTGTQSEIKALSVVNATGPWLDDFLTHTTHQNTNQHIRMVKGSHIIVNKLFTHSRCYIFQNADGRIIFAIPYEHDFTLIGTTDVDFKGDPGTVAIDQQEIAYLCQAASEYFTKPISADDVISTYSGIRPLFDDGKNEAKAATRDYVLTIDDHNSKAPLLSIYGGKITTYRKLGEAVLHKLKIYFPSMGESWTESATLPGGDFHPFAFDDQIERLLSSCSCIDRRHGERLMRYYGTRAFDLIRDIREKADLGHCFGGNLYEVEVAYLMEHEWAATADDVLWRRSNLGLFLKENEQTDLQEWMHSRRN
jgi:glycerol-3-phosphate dehydrogenase